jgi:hypothetical protein
MPYREPDTLTDAITHWVKTVREAAAEIEALLGMQKAPAATDRQGLRALPASQDEA